MNMFRIKVAILADFILDDLEFVWDHDTLWRGVGQRCRPDISPQVLHLHTVDNPFLALAEWKVVGDWLFWSRVLATMTHPRLAIAPTDGSEPSWMLGCRPSRREHTAEEWFQPSLEEGEYHWEVGSDHWDERFARTPLTRQLCTVHGILLMNQVSQKTQSYPDDVNAQGLFQRYWDLQL